MSYPFKAFGIAGVSVLALAAGITPSTAAPIDASDGQTDRTTNAAFIPVAAEAASWMPTNPPANWRQLMDDIGY
jgi:hypothetical protein